MTRLGLLCADWLRRLPGWDERAHDGRGLTPALVTEHLLLPSLTRRWPWLSADTVIVGPDEEALAGALLSQLQERVTDRLPGLCSLIDRGLAQARAALDDISAAELAGKLLTTLESFEAEGESLSDSELSAVLSTYLNNRSPHRCASPQGFGDRKRLPAAKPGRVAREWPLTGVGREALKEMRGWRPTAPPSAETIRVSRAPSGDIVIGPPRPPSSARVSLELIGARLEVDVGAPSELPTCYLHDARRSAGTVATVFGQDVARAALSAPPERRAGVECPVSIGAPLWGLVNLACLRWCRANSPVALDDALLEAQELCLVGRLSDLLADPGAWADDLAGLCGHLIGREIGREATQPDDLLDGVLVEAMELLSATDQSR